MLLEIKFTYVSLLLVCAFSYCLFSISVRILSKNTLKAKRARMFLSLVSVLVLIACSVFWFLLLVQYSGSCCLFIVLVLIACSAFCKNPLNSTWYSFNDNRAARVPSERDVVTCSAYVLFYEKRASRVESLSDPQSWIKRIGQSRCHDGSFTYDILIICIL